MYPVRSAGERLGDGGEPGLEAFVVGLSGRDSFPPARLEEFRRLPAEELRAAIDNTRAVHRRITTLVAEPPSRLALELFSCDHRWRDIAGALNAMCDRIGAAGRPYLVLAVAAYARYLRSREEALGKLAGAGLRTAA